MSIKITGLELESVKKIKAVKMTPSENGLTVIGGNNCAGKTSVLDAICWALGGDKYRPSNPKRDGDYNEPRLYIELSNGIIVERKGKNSDLRVTDKEGKRYGQTLLNEFIEELALNLPKFMAASNSDKAKTLLKIIGVGDKLMELDTQEKKLYDERYAIGRLAEQKKKYASELAYYEGLPDVPVSASELIQRQQKILLKNAENKKMREHFQELLDEKDRLTKILFETQQRLSELDDMLEAAHKTVDELEDESTAEIEENLIAIDELNSKIRTNSEKVKADIEAQALSEEYDEFTKAIESIRDERLLLLNNADLPLPGLSTQDGELTYNGHKWDCLSGAEQLRVATAIVRKLKPECGFVLLDGLEAFDLNTLNDFGVWLDEQGLQAIATRVSTGPECTLIIEDGYGSTESNVGEYTKGVF